MIIEKNFPICWARTNYFSIRTEITSNMITTNLKINKKEVFSFIEYFSCWAFCIPLRDGSDFEICFHVTLSTSYSFQHESKNHSVFFMNCEWRLFSWGGEPKMGWELWHVNGDSWQGINVGGGGGSLFEIGLSPWGFMNQRIFTGTIFFSDGPTFNKREFLRILYHNKAFVIVLC